MLLLAPSVSRRKGISRSAVKVGTCAVENDSIMEAYLHGQFT